MIWRLGPKIIIMFLVGTVGVMVGGFLVIFIVGIVSSEMVGGIDVNVVWCGMVILVGSWIGGGVN